MKRSVPVVVTLGRFALRALAGEHAKGPEDMAARMVRAISYYLNDADSDHPGWPYPDFLRGRVGGPMQELEITVKEDLWAQFEVEAEKQGVTLQQLAEHAALYYAAELNAGRVTERILGDIKEDEAEA
jgi:hypothetical protein